MTTVSTVALLIVRGCNQIGVSTNQKYDFHQKMGEKNSANK